MNCQCDTLGEIYYEGKCKKIEGVNGVTQVPKWNRETQRLASVLIGIIVPLVIVVAVIVYFLFWLFFGKGKKNPEHEAVQRHQQPHEMQAVS